MRLDHIAYRVANRDAAVKFFQDAFGYHFQAEFEIFFNDEKTDKAMCVALEPPEKEDGFNPGPADTILKSGYHLPPEIFISEGTPGSIVWNWVYARGGVGGIHHLAYEVESVEAQRKLWLEKGWGDFTSEKPFHCEDLTQIFSTPHKLTGMVYEFIERKGFGFCKDNVKELMKSTALLDGNMK